MEQHLLKLRPVKSSNISNVGYDAANKMAAVNFKKLHEVYLYFGVPQKVFDLWVTSESLGKFFLENIKDRYHYTKVEMPVEAANKVTPV